MRQERALGIIVWGFLMSVMRIVSNEHTMQ